MGSSDNGTKEDRQQILEITQDYIDADDFIDLTDFRDNDFIEDDLDDIDTEVMPQDEIDALRVTAEPGRLEDLKMEYGGMQRTTTGVIRLMRDDGKEVVAELLEEMREACAQAQRSLDGLKRLHKRRTGQFPRPVLKRETSE